MGAPSSWDPMPSSARRQWGTSLNRGVPLLNCSGEAAWQDVFHFHIHVIPRFKDQPGKDAIRLPWDSVPGNPDEIERIGDLLA